MKNTAYTNLANWFEELNDDCDYENWSQYLILKLKQYVLITKLFIKTKRFIIHIIYRLNLQDKLQIKIYKILLTHMNFKKNLAKQL